MCSFRLEGKEGADLREAVFRAFAQSGLPLLELRRDQMTLEDIFLRLTSDGQPPAPPESGAEEPAEEPETEEGKEP